MRKEKHSLIAISAAIIMTTVFTSPSAKADVDPLIGQIMMVGTDSCPQSQIKADGQLLDISANQALFSLYGNQYGGDGRTVFGVPDLRGRMAIGGGTGPGLNPRYLGEKGGQESVILGIESLPSHSHTLKVSSGSGYADASDANGAVLAGAEIYTNTQSNQVMGESIDSSGGGLGHNNMAPYRVITYCIATQGIFPSRS